MASKKIEVPTSGTLLGSRHLLHLPPLGIT
ncbi:hypothetical protein G4B88_009956, partial [Cannabis sativa]